MTKEVREGGDSGVLAPRDAPHVPKLRVLDLFSGIGGFSLGLERTGGFETVAFCEIDPFCRRILAKHWPRIPVHEDVTKLRGDDVGAVDVICGGFPCQDISEAGRRGGVDGARSGLWRELLRLTEALNPIAVIIENSDELARRGLLEIVTAFAQGGYDAIWQAIPASSVGARHIRCRMWIVCLLPDTSIERFGECWRLELAAARNQRRGLHLRFNEPEPPRVADGIAGRMDRTRATGNAVVPQIPEAIGRAILEARNV